MGIWSDAKQWMFGGGATEGLDTKGAHYGQASSYLQNALGGVNQRQAPTAQAAQLGSAAQLANGPQADARAQLGGVTGQLQRIMSGQQAGAGELAVNRQVGQATAAQQAAARMARGANAALAARNAARNTADIGLAGAGQAAQAQMQDQQGATNALGGILGQMRAQDIDLAGQNAQLQQQRMLQQGAFNQQTGLANQQAALQQMSLNDQAAQSYLAQMLGMDAQQFQREMAKRQLAAQDTGHLGSLLQGLGSIGTTYATGGFGGGPLFGGGGGSGGGGLPSDAQIRNDYGYGTTGPNGLVTPAGW